MPRHWLRIGGTWLCPLDGTHRRGLDPGPATGAKLWPGLFAKPLLLVRQRSWVKPGMCLGTGPGLRPHPRSRARRSWRSTSLSVGTKLFGLTLSQIRIGAAMYTDE